MIIYHVTVKIDTEVETEWLDWMQRVHIPDVMKTGYFERSQLARVISMADTDGTSYSIQYHCKDMATLHRYQVQAAPALQKEHTDRYAGKFAAVRTLLEIVD